MGAFLSWGDVDLKKKRDIRRRAFELYKQYGHRSASKVARELSLPERTVRHWAKMWANNVKPVDSLNAEDSDVSEMEILKDTVKTLRSELNSRRRDSLTDQYVREKIIGLAAAPIEPPKWMLSSRAVTDSPGLPTLFASDWHWGEVVDKSQLSGSNEYSIEVGHARARKLVEYTMRLLNDHLVNPKYEGIVFALGGDMVSGDIHDELSATNEFEIMPTVVDLIGVLTWCIDQLASQFGKVFVPCVTGNHGRNTKKMRAKGRNYTSFDWLIYQMLEHRFAGDPDVQFLIPDGPDALYSVYGRRYLLTHGDQFRGGDGMIGALGPIIRGDHKKRSRNSQIDMEYDTMICGHWHQLIQLQRLIVNGSLKGYDEYAFGNNFPFEPPRQALWLTHPKWGITFSCPVQVEDPAGGLNADQPWIQWKK